MKLLVILLCLLSERFLIHSISYGRFSWFGNYCLTIKKLMDKSNLGTNSWFLLVGRIAPLIIFTSLVYWVFHNMLFGLGGLILSILFLFYSIGPQNVFYPLSDSTLSNNILVGNYLAKVNSELFAVIFWYVVAGPIAALTYRLFALSRYITDVSEEANQITDILEWVPARMTVLLYLLVGNFQRGFSLFMRFFLSKPHLNTEMLSECGLQAVRSDNSIEVPMPLAENLVEHAIIVLLVFIALLTFAWL
jgi:AmpE protein